MIKEIYSHPKPIVDARGEEILLSIHKFATILGDHVANTDIHVSSLITDEEIDDLVLIVTGDDSEEYSFLDDYYTKDEIDNMGFLKEIPDEYVTLAMLNLRLTGIETDLIKELKEYFKDSTDLTNYYDKQSIRDLISSYASQQWVNNLLKNYYTSDEVDDLIKDFDGVTVTPVYTSGEWIATINNTKIYAPNGGTGSADGNNYVLSGELSEDYQLCLHRNGGLSDIKIDLSTLHDTVDSKGNITNNYSNRVSAYKCTTTSTSSLDTPTGGTIADGGVLSKAPTGWYISPIKAYQGFGTTTENRLLIWVSYCTVKTYETGTTQTWTTPIPYMYIDTNLEKEDSVVYTVNKTIYLLTDATSVDTPSGGFISDWATATLSECPSGWTEVVPTYDKNKYIYFATRWFRSNNPTDNKTNTTLWSTPGLFFTKNEANDTISNKNVSYGAALYSAILSGDTKPTVPGERNYEDSVSASDKYPEFDWVNGVILWKDTSGISNASKWFTTISEATSQYADTVNNSKIIIYKTYCNYIETKTSSGTLTSRSKTNWTTPLLFIDINDILDKADARAAEIANNALDLASGDLTSALDNLKSLFSWTKLESTDDSYGTCTSGVTVESSSALSNYTGKTYYNKTATVGTDTYKYIADIAQLSNLFAQLQKDWLDEENKLNSAVASISPDQIRLQVSEGIYGNILWLTGKSSDYDNTEAHTFSDGPLDIEDTSNIEYDVTYKFGKNLKGETTDQPYYYIACVAPTNTGFINVFSDNINLGVTNDENNKAIINLTLNNGTGNSAIELTSDQIVLNGDTIAAAIAAKSLNIDNLTYIFPKPKSIDDNNYYNNLPDDTDWPVLYTCTETVYPLMLLGAATSGMSAFYNNGTGYLAGGLISWNSDKVSGSTLSADGGKTNDITGFHLNVEGYVNAKAGLIGENNPWYIGTYLNQGIIYNETTDSNNNLKSIFISPNSIYSKTGTSTGDNAAISLKYPWKINSDGSASFSNGQATFNADGTFKLGTADGNGISYTYSDGAYHLELSADSIKLGDKARQNLVHDPYVDDKTGYLYVWLNGDYVNTGITAKDSTTKTVYVYTYTSSTISKPRYKILSEVENESSENTWGLSVPNTTKAIYESYATFNYNSTNSVWEISGEWSTPYIRYAAHDSSKGEDASGYMMYPISEQAVVSADDNQNLTVYLKYVLYYYEGSNKRLCTTSDGPFYLVVENNIDGTEYNDCSDNVKTVLRSDNKLYTTLDSTGTITFERNGNNDTSVWLSSYHDVYEDSPTQFTIKLYKKTNPIMGSDIDTEELVVVSYQSLELLDTRVIDVTLAQGAYFKIDNELNQISSEVSSMDGKYSTIELTSSAIDLSVKNINNKLNNCGIHLENGTIDLIGNVNIDGDHSLTVLDENDITKVVISPESIPTLDNLPTGNNYVSTFYHNPYGYGSNGVSTYTSTYTLGSITTSEDTILLKNLVYTIKVKGANEAVSTEYDCTGHYEGSVVLCKDGVAMEDCSWGADEGITNIIPSSGKIIILLTDKTLTEIGTYTLEVTTKTAYQTAAVANQYPYTCVRNTIAILIITDQTGSAYTAIGKDGFFSTQGTDKYLYLGSDLTIIKYGNDGIKLSDNGLQRLGQKSNATYDWGSFSRRNVKVLTDTDSTNFSTGTDYDMYVLNTTNNKNIVLPSRDHTYIGQTIRIKHIGNGGNISVSSLSEDYIIKGDEGIDKKTTSMTIGSIMREYTYVGNVDGNYCWLEGNLGYY